MSRLHEGRRAGYGQQEGGRRSCKTRSLGRSPKGGVWKALPRGDPHLVPGQVSQSRRFRLPLFFSTLLCFPRERQREPAKAIGRARLARALGSAC